MTASAARMPRSASPPKRARVSLLGHYSVIAQQDAEAGQQQERQLQAYIDHKNSAAFRKQDFLSQVHCLSTHCAHLQALLGRLNECSLKAAYWWDHTILCVWKTVWITSVPDIPLIRISLAAPMLQDNQQWYSAQMSCLQWSHNVRTVCDVGIQPWPPLTSRDCWLSLVVT